jgi:hypothetical protein
MRYEVGQKIVVNKTGEVGVIKIATPSAPHHVIPSQILPTLYWVELLGKPALRYQFSEEEIRSF